MSQLRTLGVGRWALLLSAGWQALSCGGRAERFGAGQPSSHAAGASSAGGTSSVGGGASAGGTSSRSGAASVGGAAGLAGVASVGGAAGLGGVASVGGAAGTCGSAGCSGLGCQIAICAGNGHTTVTGKIYDPAGKVPLYNVLVYVPSGAPEALSSGAMCPVCTGSGVQTSVASALTDTTGAFTMFDVPSGTNIPLVIQSGEWRRQISMPAVESCQDNAVDDPDLFRLPRDRSEGDLPKIAVTTGGGDALECFLHRVGVSDSEITLYSGLGGTAERDDGTPVAPLASLLSDANTLGSFGLLMMSCEDSEAQAQLTPTTDKAALKAYADTGGVLFLEHFQAAYLRGDAGYQPTPFATVSTGWSSGPAASGPYSVDITFPKGLALSDWLGGVAESPTPGTTTVALQQVQNAALGLVAPTQRWLYDSASIPLFEFHTPTDVADDLQCGRVVQMGFHVSASEDQVGTSFPSECGQTSLSAAERALEFQLFDTPSCVVADHVTPTPPCGGALPSPPPPPHAG